MKSRNTRTPTAKTKKPATKTTVKKPTAKKVSTKQAVKAKPKQSVKATLKPKAKPKTTKTTNTRDLAKLSKKNESLIIPDGVIVDLGAYDWEGEELTERQQLFIIWFSTPGTRYYHMAIRAALKAGYSTNTANAEAYKMRQNPKIDRFIRKFENTIVKTNTIDVVQRWIQEKVTRGDYKVKDFYETVSYVNEKTGEPVRKLQLKDLEDLDDEQMLCIDGVDVKGQQGTMIYTLPDREKVRDSLISLVQKMDHGNKDDEEEETIEIIMERLTVKKTVRQAKDETSQVAGLIRLPRKSAITEL
jgi:phage terminase small subunit